MNASGEIIFREQMREEAKHLLNRIKIETNHSRKHTLCANLLEILEELDIEIARHSPLWGEINMKYQDFFN